jgi:hypothetical protein
VAEDLATATAQPVDQVPQETIPLHQKLPNDRPTHYADFDPLNPPRDVQPDRVNVEQIADGYHATTTRRAE